MNPKYAIGDRVAVCTKALEIVVPATVVTAVKTSASNTFYALPGRDTKEVKA